MRYQHRRNPRLIAYSDDQPRAVPGKPGREPFVIVCIHTIGAARACVESEFTRSLFHRIYRLDLTRR